MNMLNKKYGKTILLLLLSYIVSLPVYAWRKWEYVNPQDIEIRICPDTPEIESGKTATFTVTIRNKTDKTVHLTYKTGQEWDLAVYHKRVQIYRWSQGLLWNPAKHSIPIAAHDKLTHKMTWTSTDHLGRKLPEDIYRVEAMVMVQPRHLVSNLCSIRLLPPKVDKEKVIKTKLGKFFEIQLPRYSNNKELKWKLKYVYNDNRVSLHKITKEGKNVTLTFLAKRRGYVTVNLYAFNEFKSIYEAIERKTFRIEVR